MKARHRRARWVLAAACGCAPALVGGPAHADPPSAVGWWSTSSSGGLQALLAGVPKDGLLVQGGSGTDVPAAYAAVRYAGPSTAQVVRLDLPVASRSPASAGVHACPLTVATFAPAHGGPATAAPPYDCAHTVPGVVTADGRTVSFAVAPLVHDGALAVAIVPDARNARVVLSAPSSSAVVTAAVASSPSATPRAAATRASPSHASHPSSPARTHAHVEVSASVSPGPAAPELAVLPPPELPAEATARAADVPAPVVVGPPSDPPVLPTEDAPLVTASATPSAAAAVVVAAGRARAPSSAHLGPALESLAALTIALACLLPSYLARRRVRASGAFPGDATDGDDPAAEPLG